MSDDIVKRLHNWSGFVDPMLWDMMVESVAEIERLRKAGDALANGIRTGQWDDALDAWTELRGD